MPSAHFDAVSIESAKRGFNTFFYNEAVHYDIDRMLFIFL